MDHVGNAVVSRYWGKADPTYPHAPGWHPLPYHSLDVAAVGAAWWEQSASIRRAVCRALGVDADADADQGQARAWMLFFLALHDLGKFDVRFQLKAPDTVRQAWPSLDPNLVERSPIKIGGFDHGRWGGAWAGRECRTWLNDPEGGRSLKWMPWIASVVGHHGEYPSCTDQPGDFADESVVAGDRAARAQWVSIASGIFLHPAGLDLSATPTECTTAQKALLAGFCSVSDWIGSNTGVAPYRALEPELSFKDYFSARLASIQEGAWLKRFGLISQSQPFGGLGRLLRNGESARGVQVLVDHLPLDPGLTLIEAPTGSGKTEAALAQAWRLIDAGMADAIVFALPTQATANAMLTRAEAFANLPWPGAGNIVLAHGKRNLSDAFQRLIDTARTRTAQGRSEASAQCAEWLAASRKRVFLGQMGVGTVDQILLSVLPVRHNFVRGFGLARSILIVDEVHAYDTYMHGLLAEVLRRQKAAGGSAVLLSATLPASVRNKLLLAWGMTGAEVADYPAVWTGQDGMIGPISVPDNQRPQTRVVFVECMKLPSAEPDAALIQRLVDSANAGARIAVVVNLVDVAQRLAKQLRQNTTCPVDIFHSRYRFADRQGKEQSALANYGRGAVRDGGRILVATQVVEQSLDLDFDWMVTQICPVDLLFQRLGRLHRHDLPENDRPENHRTPQCTVLTVDDEDYGLHKLIYGNARVLWRTQMLLNTSDHITFPLAYRDWINRVYDIDDWPDEPEAIRRDHDRWWGEQRAAAAEANQWINTPRSFFADLDKAITVKTRDGEMSLSILAMRDNGCLYDGSELSGEPTQAHLLSLELNTIPVPASWQRSLSGCEHDETGNYCLAFSTGADGWVAATHKAQFRYSENFGLERDIL